MNMMKFIFTIAITMAIFISTVTIANTKRGEEEQVLMLPVVKVANDEYSTKTIAAHEASSLASDQEEYSVPIKRVSRFLVEGNGNGPRPKYHCNKDYSVCDAEGSPGSTCCLNKCVDLKNDEKNCGECGKKCKYTNSCCNGQCVNLAFDKRHCGECYNRCTAKGTAKAGYCIYGMCDYA